MHGMFDLFSASNSAEAIYITTASAGGMDNMQS